MFTYLFILLSYFFVGTVLLLLVVKHLFYMAVFFPSLKSALFLLFIEITENSSPVFLCHLVMMSEGTEPMIVLSKRP